MKKIILSILTIVMCLTLVGCGSKTPDNLVGEWEGVTESDTHVATITEDSIEVYWENDGTKALYWSGTFANPKTVEQPYIFESANNKEKTENALLASRDEVKKFTYENGELSYEVSALGMTRTTKLKKVEE